MSDKEERRLKELLKHVDMIQAQKDHEAYEEMLKEEAGLLIRPDKY